MITKDELRKKLNDGIVMLSEALIELESLGGEEELLKQIDELAAKYIAEGSSKNAAYQKAGEEVLTPIEISKRRAERESRRATI